MSLDCNGSNDSFDSKENRGLGISQTSSISDEFREPTLSSDGSNLSIEDDESCSDCWEWFDGVDEHDDSSSCNKPDEHGGEDGRDWEEWDNRFDEGQGEDDVEISAPA